MDLKFSKLKGESRDDELFWGYTYVHVCIVSKDQVKKIGHSGPVSEQKNLSVKVDLTFYEITQQDDGTDDAWGRGYLKYLKAVGFQARGIFEA